MVNAFSDEERRGVYRAIYERRDVRSHFLPDPVPDELIEKIESVSVSKTFADAIRAVFEEGSVSEIFGGENQN